MVQRYFKKSTRLPLAGLSSSQNKMRPVKEWSEHEIKTILELNTFVNPCVDFLLGLNNSQLVVCV